MSRPVDNLLVMQVVLAGELDETAWEQALRQGIRERAFFPVYTGSALHGQGVETLLQGLDRFTETRYDPEAPLRRGMQGGRVKALQHALNARGAALEEDGVYGEKTAQAYAKHLGTAGPETPETPVAQVEITGERVNLRAGPGTDYPVLDTLRAGELLALVDTEGWRTVLRDGVLAYVSEAYSREVKPS